jgi:hypothetical protein
MAGAGAEAGAGVRRTRRRPGPTRTRGAILDAGSQIVGLAMARYIVGVAALADADREEIVAAVGPTIQRYLTEPL